MYEFKLPDVGEGIHEATIVNWKVKVGDQVKLDQPLLEVETDKAVVEIPAPAPGTIAELPLAAGTLAKVGDVLVLIQTEENPATAPLPTSAVSKAAPTTLTKPQAIGIAGPGERILAAPAVRKRALELGIDLRQVTGTAAGGRVTMQDLERFATQEITAGSAPVVAAEPVQTATSSQASISEPLQGLRKRIAERMTQAWQIPHVTSFEEVTVKRLVKTRKRFNALAELHNERLTYLPFIIKAVVQTLQALPYFNASLDMHKEQIIVHQHYHIGIATAINEGLVVPVLRHAEQLSIIAINRELKRLGVLARERKLTPSELTGSTFTITNFGSFHGQSGTPIINPPESAILGCGRIETKPWVKNKGKLTVRPVLPLALSFDHRLHDGAAAAQFLSRIKILLTDPSQLLLHLK